MAVGDPTWAISNVAYGPGPNAFKQVPSHCEAYGHHIEISGMTTYADGLLVSNCTVCGVRVAVEGTPADSLSAQLTSLVESLMAGDQLDYARLTLEQLQDRVQILQESLDGCLASVALAQGIIAQRSANA